MEMLNNVSFSHLVCRSRPYATAKLQGNDLFPDITGTVRLYQADQGALVVAEVFNLPHSAPGADTGFGPFYAFHLHEGNACGSGAGKDPFREAGGHFNPARQRHPNHAGDFPPLLGNAGYAYASFYTGRFTPRDVLGKTVIIHQGTDDFLTQPGGNAGVKLACGVVYLDIQPLDD